MSSPEHPPRRLGRRHLRAPIFIYLVVGGLLLVTTRTWTYALGVALGPFAGGFARDWQSCCAANSLAIAPYAGGALTLGFLSQLALAPTSSSRRLVRRILWSLAWTAWFLSALLSYAHALE